MMLPSGAARVLPTLLLLWTAHAASAGEVHTVINGKSFHLGSERDWNEENYGLGVEYQFATDTRWKSVLMANGFRDSDNNMSYMAGGGLHRNLYASERLGGVYVDLGLNAFLMTRQDVNDGQPFPGVLPNVTVGNRVVGVNLTYLPNAAIRKVQDPRARDENMRGIVFLQFKVNVAGMLGAD